jgi:hypothetical protein
MGQPVLSTTTLLELLKQNKASEFVRQVTDHLAAWPSDCTSALKALKTLAFFLFERTVESRSRAGIAETAVCCTRVLTAGGRLTESAALDILGSLFQVLSRQDVVILNNTYHFQ